MIINYGKIVEFTIRAKGISLEELAFELRTNRRTLYNWFQTPLLKRDVIYVIGMAIHHDFSREFPQLFKSNEFAFRGSQLSSGRQHANFSIKGKSKFVKLLE
ncbi:hypothetical protein IM792_15630 [Mucilaginibacter sp. JRF]|uniref:hypothetical protein n=1 Tax=Mucilaginibacter sp. JRF TaxID=2780088 RepID=UPI0018816CD6|nr:hypothetical protein [Mucilaginibacter sp. JRF]MBE9585887.1 hypothetical protein [Mucilaginibacter sp. JRF]